MRFVRITFSSEWQEFTVRLSDAKSGEGYFTDDILDAYATAQHIAKSEGVALRLSAAFTRRLRSAQARVC